MNPGRALEPSRLRVNLEIVETHAESHCGELRVDYGWFNFCGRKVIVLLIRLILWTVDHLVGLLSGNHADHYHEEKRDNASEKRVEFLLALVSDSHGNSHRVILTDPFSATRHITTTFFLFRSLIFYSILI